MKIGKFEEKNFYVYKVFFFFIDILYVIFLYILKINYEIIFFKEVICVGILYFYFIERDFCS